MEYFSASQYATDSETSSSSPSSPTADNRSLSPHLATAYNAGAETADVFRAVVKCRKSWKTLKGGKVVWPLHLEAALLDGLALYQPDNSRETLLLGRFPMRNRFISEHIYRTTGETRTAKQVGSRLQQLRDTCGGGKKLQKLLSPVVNSSSTVSNRSQYSLRRFGSRSPGLSAPTSPVSTEDVELTRKTLSSSPTMYIDIIPEGRASSLARDCADFNGGSVDITVAPFHGPRPIRSIKPCLAFISDSPIVAHSNFVIYHGEKVYQDSSSLAVAIDQGSTPPPEGTLVYTCDLVPTFWNMICNSSDPTEFIIDHTITQQSSVVMFSATYKFRYLPEKTHTLFTIPSFQEVSRECNLNRHENFHAGNIPEMASNWQDCFDDLSLAEPRGYTSGCWDEFGSASIDGSCSSSSSPTTANFPHHSEYYSPHQML